MCLIKIISNLNYYYCYLKCNKIVRIKKNIFERIKMHHCDRFVVDRKKMCR